VPRAVLRLLADLLAPRACAVCGLPGPSCCAACLAALPAPPPPRCARCGHPWALAVTRCRECRGPLVRADQACLYAGAAPALVGALKDRRRRDLAPLMAAVIAARCPPPPRGAVLVPVPLGTRRRRRRGFNQSALLAHGLARAWGAPVRADALRRTGPEPPQRGASRRGRARQVAGAFHARGAVPEVCWLVDDVHTTGATLAACAVALRRAGAARVGAVAFARVVR